jgi:hypothetical protein
MIMARVKWSKNVLEVQKSANAIVAKDINDADKSVIKPYLVKHNIVLAEVKTGMELVVKKDADRVLEEGDANAKLADRDALMMPIENVLHGWGQRLKSYYSDNIKEVQSWSIVILESGKIVYPADFLSKVSLVQSILLKHASFKAPAVSPLEVYNTENDVNVATISANLTLAMNANEQAQAKRNAATTATADRNKLYKPISKTLKGISGEICSIYPNDPNKWKDWGLDVVLEPVKKQAERTVKVPKGKTIKKTNIVIGTVFKNTGNVDLLIEKGGKKKGAPVLVKQSEEILMGKGYSTIVVTAAEVLKDGAFTVTVNL